MIKQLTLVLVLSTITSYGYGGCSGYSPVCGSNGITYNNACQCRQARVQVAYAQSCTKTKIVSVGGGYGGHGGYG